MKRLCLKNFRPITKFFKPFFDMMNGHCKLSLITLAKKIYIPGIQKATFPFIVGKDVKEMFVQK